MRIGRFSTSDRMLGNRLELRDMETCYVYSIQSVQVQFHSDGTKRT